MTARGFTLVELLVATLVSALVVSALVAAISPARAAFETAPAALELQQRARVAGEFLESAIRSAGIEEPGNRHASIGGSFVPSLIPALGSGRGNLFSDFEVFRPVTGGRGVLAVDQPSAGAALTLLSNRECAHVRDVCGFVAGAIAAISDGQGRFDIFEVAAADPVWMTLLPLHPLSAPYAAGSRLHEAETFRFSLAPQTGGSKALVRTPRSGGAQPVVDGIADLTISLWGEAGAPQITWDGADGTASYGPSLPSPAFSDGGNAWPAGESCLMGRDIAGPWSRLVALGPPESLVQLSRSSLNDGPWCAGGSLGIYDADLVRLRRVDVEIRLQSPVRKVPDRTITTSVYVRNQR
jgi:prepilin-type N-terminal cleavage/methylation domain-containing protein